MEAPSFLQPFENFPTIQAAWIPRIPSANVLGDREFALKNLAPHHHTFITKNFPATSTRHHAEQIHTANTALISLPSLHEFITHPLVDGLITNLPGQLLAIYVADCTAIYLADPITHSIALLHSGKKGTELNILSAAVQKMTAAYGTNPAHLTCIISPSIRPPDYEIDFPATIRSQAATLGIENIHDTLENTASTPHTHYSYRREKGQTGRMLALLQILPNP